LTVLPVEVDEKANGKGEMVVLGNPVMNEACLELTVMNQRDFTISVSDVAGLRLCTRQVRLAEGNNKITLSGLGAPGIKIVRVTDGQKTYTAKVVQTANAGNNPQIRSTAFSGNQGVLKSASYTTQLKIEFTPQPAGFVPNSKIVPAQSAIVNDTVWQTSQTINKVLNVYDVNGLAVAPGQSPVASYYFLKTKFKDGTEITFPAVNGVITINRTEYGTNLTDTLTFIPDTIQNHKFLEWMIGRKIQQQRYEPNVFVNDKIHIPVHYIPPGNVRVAVANMPSPMQLYLVPEKMLDPRNMTDSITLDKTKISPQATYPLTIEIMGRGPPIYASKFIDVTSARPLYFVIDTWDAYTGATIPVSEQDRVQVELEKQVNFIPFLANGDSLLPGFEIVRLAQNSPLWQQILERGDNQYHESKFKTGAQPGNGAFLTYTGSYNGKLIMKNSNSSYPPNANTFVIGEELWEGIWCMTDPSVGGTSPFIYNNNGSGAISDYCKTITRWKLLLDPGTYIN